jgi:acyl carrier protein
MTIERRMELLSLEERATQGVRSVLASIVRNVKPSDIPDNASVVDDLGLDSLRFVDLTLALEQALDIENLPLQDWYDSESLRSEGRFSVASLVRLCVECMRGRR